MRYNWKYYGFIRASIRSLLIISFQSLEAIQKKLSPIAYTEGILSMISSSFYARRKEKNLIPNDKLEIFLTHNNLFKVYINFFKEKIKSKLKK